ncbi:MAG TPA: SH3 domain-containing protein, partial [bacterium]|nr:SH3 domain-containing protein [bacterium]
MSRPFHALRLLLSAAALLLPASAFAGDTMYVRAAGTELKGAASPGAPVVEKLDIGAKVELLEKNGMWAKIKTKDDKTGFVFGPKLSKDKPDKEHFGKSGNALAANEGDTAQALRGLSPTAEKFAGRTDIKPADVAAVKAMEDRKATPQDVDAFLKEGKLGEYMQ